MDIVLVTPFYPAHGGGVEKVAAQLAAGMVAAGHSVRWFASDCDAPPEWPGVHCEPMPSFNGVERWSGFPWPVWSPPALRRLARAVRQADAVHVHDAIYASSMAAAALARWYLKPLVVTQHIGAVPLPPLLRPLLALANRVGARLVLRAADAVAFISPAVRRYFESITGPDRRFHDVPNGVDASLFSPGPCGPAQQRALLGFDPHRPLLLFVGRWVPKKRLPLLREMAQARPDWQWCVIGQGPEQPAAWGLPNVRVLSPLPHDELVAYYRAADLLVLPSEGEGFPLVVQEAMACGLPACITADVAAGAVMPAALWLELPEAEAPGATAALGVAAMAAWLSGPEDPRSVQRAACAQHAAGAWRWEQATQSHLDWLLEGVR